MIIRRKSRYILVEASRDIDLSDRQVQADLSEGISRVIGNIGHVNASPKVMAQLNPRLFILRVSRGFEGDVIIALAFTKEIKGSEIGLYTIRTSGSMLRLKEVAASQDAQ